MYPFTLSTEEKQNLHRLLKELDPQFDPQENLLATSEVYGGNVGLAHFEFVDGKLHILRESLGYALTLLVSEDPDHHSRAEKILNRMFELQYRNPESHLHGLWPYYSEYPVEKWKLPDLNWADFNALTLLLIWHLCQEKLSPQTQAKLKEALSLACQCIRTRNVSMGYTNIAVKGTFVTLAASELLEDKDLFAYALDRAHRLHDEIVKKDRVSEYCSPTYGAVTLQALITAEHLLQNKEAKTLLREVQNRVWQHFIPKFHIPSGELIGPNSRSYGDLVTDKANWHFYALIEATSEGQYQPQNPHDPSFGEILYRSIFKPSMPKDLLEIFKQPEREVFLQENARGRHDRIQSTEICPAYGIGSISMENGFRQRRNLIAKWCDNESEGNNPKPGYMTYHFMNGPLACASGFFTSAQCPGMVVAGNFLIDGNDTHPGVSIEGKVKTSYLGPVFQFHNSSSPIVATLGETLLSPESSKISLSDQDHLWIEAGTVRIAIKCIYHDAPPFPQQNPYVLFQSPNLLEIKAPHYEGPEKELLWTDFKHTTSAFALWITPRETPFSPWKEKVISETIDIQHQDDRIVISSRPGEIFFPRQVLEAGAFFKEYELGE